MDPRSLPIRVVQLWCCRPEYVNLMIRFGWTREAEIAGMLSHGRRHPHLYLLLAIANWPASFENDLGDWFPGVMDGVVGLMVLALVLPRWVRLAGDR
jgi:hypothetical protein